MAKVITSTTNSTIKSIVLLQEKSKERRKKERFVVEGFKEIKLAIEANFQIVDLLFCPEIFPESKLNELGIIEKISFIQITKQVYKKIAYRGSTEGILAILKTKKNDLNSLKFTTKNPLVLVAEAPEKPGNIGALLRTADAAKLNAVLIANPKTDLYNPNIIRSSVGCLFSVPIATGTTQTIIDYLKKKNIAIYSAILQKSIPYQTCDFTKPSAIVVGTEATGLSETWRTESTKNIHIPMQGKIDSLNVSVAAGILIFEAKRQRNFNL